MLKSIFSHLDKAKSRLENDSNKVINYIYQYQIKHQYEITNTITEHMKSSINEMKEKEKEELDVKKSEIVDKQRQLESRIQEVEREIFVILI